MKRYKQQKRNNRSDKESEWQMVGEKIMKQERDKQFKTKKRVNKSQGRNKEKHEAVANAEFGLKRSNDLGTQEATRALLWVSSSCHYECMQTTNCHSAMVN